MKGEKEKERTEKKEQNMPPLRLDICLELTGSPAPSLIRASSANMF